MAREGFRSGSINQVLLVSNRPTTAAPCSTAATGFEVFFWLGMKCGRDLLIESLSAHDRDRTSPQEASRRSATDWRVISVAVAPKKMHAEVQETNAPPSGQ